MQRPVDRCPQKRRSAPSPSDKAAPREGRKAASVSQRCVGSTPIDTRGERANTRGRERKGSWDKIGRRTRKVSAKPSRGIQGPKAERHETSARPFPSRGRASLEQPACHLARSEHRGRNALACRGFSNDSRAGLGHRQARKSRFSYGYAIFARIGGRGMARRDEAGWAPGR